MINADLFWYMLVPLVLSVAGVFIIPKETNGRTDVKAAAAFSGFGLLIACIILALAFYIGKGSKTHDTELWNGEVISKERVHGSYVESYQCNCRTVTSGSGKNASTSTVCDTCYRDHFTVHWKCHANVDDYTIAAEDWTNRGVYLLPDPARYTIIKPGDPVAVEKSYTNYIKAVPESLFRPLAAPVKAQFTGKIPKYPIDVYDFYHVDRVLSVGVNVPNRREWNDKLSDALKTLGPQKQANVVIVFTNLDENYYYALQDAWLNGKKNDIIVVIGAPDFPGKATWVNVMALSQSDIFQVKLRDDILALDQLTADNVIGTIKAETLATFKRKHMRDFKYLDAEIDPPAWVMWVAEIFVVLGYLGLWYFIYREAAQWNSRRSTYFGSYRRW